MTHLGSHSTGIKGGRNVNRTSYVARWPRFHIAALVCDRCSSEVPASDRNQSSIEICTPSVPYESAEVDKPQQDCADAKDWRCMRAHARRLDASTAALTDAIVCNEITAYR